MYDAIVIGSGAAGIMAAIRAVQKSKKILLLEKLDKISQKLKATGGGKCNITNTLSNEDFMTCFGRNGYFMRDALSTFNHQDLISFLKNIGVECVSLDGKRYFPKSKNSQSIIDALVDEMQRLEVNISCASEVKNIIYNKENIYEIHLKSKKNLQKK